MTKPVQTTPCPHCGAGREEAQSVCANCGAFLGSVWPPAVTAGPPEAGPARVRLLTGRVGLDDALGWGLANITLYGLGRLFVFVYEVYSYHLNSCNFTHADWRDALLWRLHGLTSVAATGGVYLLLRRLFPVMGRHFGWGLLASGGAAFAIISCLRLFP